MGDAGDSYVEDAVWIADSGLFIACGRTQNNKYTALERFARRNEITFVIPQRVHDELGGAPNRSTPGQTPIQRAIEDDWVVVADEPDYTAGTVSSVMDDVRSYIARQSNRDEDTIEKADTALAGIAAQLLIRGEAPFVYIVTTDTTAGEGAVSAVEAHGFDSQIEFKDGFTLIKEIV